MTFTEWFLFFMIIQVVHFAGTWKLYTRAGRKSWEAIVPVYNAIVLLGIIKRPKWWVILLFFPIVNLLMFPILWIESARSFGFNQRKDTALVVLTLGLYLFYINYATDAPYKEERSLDPRTSLGEWVSSIAFAIIAATMVHTYFMQPYTIPTSSLEKTLLVGDYLLVSKFHYGARVPMTTIAAPMLHDSLPTSIVTGKNSKSYVKSPQLPYMRMPGFQKIKRNDIVVFSWPVDTLVHWTKPQWGTDYKPIDKKTNYVKRCVGIPGDSLEVRDGYVYINGVKNVLPSRAKLQFNFIIDTEGQPLDMANMKERFGVKEYGVTRDGSKYVFTLTEEEAQKIKAHSKIKSVTKKILSRGLYDNAFPKVPSSGWNMDNFGPIYIPKQGETVALDEKSLPFYRRIISEYEHNQLDIIGDNYFINGRKADSYTFKQDYFWMMGDNRQNSLDARDWGYVPFDHVVGKPVLIWFSWDANAGSFGAKIKSIRWDRMFTTVGGDGEPVSYFRYFLIVLGLYIAYSVYKGRKKKAA